MDGLHHVGENPRLEPHTEYPRLVMTLRVALFALAVYQQPRPTALGFGVGVFGLLKGGHEGAQHQGCHCHASIDFIELLAGGTFNEIAKLMIPTAFVVAHLNKRLFGCCATVEALLMGGIGGTFMHRLWIRHRPTED